MQQVRVPLDFNFHCQHWRCTFATGDTATFWFGALVVAGMIWNLWSDYRRTHQLISGWRNAPAHNGMAILDLCGAVHIGTVHDGVWPVWAIAFQLVDLISWVDI